MKYHKRVTELLARCEDSDSWDIGENEELRLIWREEVEGNFVQIYKDLLEMEQELAALRKYKENTAVYVRFVNCLEAVLAARGVRVRDGLIR